MKTLGALPVRGGDKIVAPIERVSHRSAVSWWWQLDATQ